VAQRGTTNFGPGDFVKGFRKKFFGLRPKVELGAISQSRDKLFPLKNGKS
jgi:hypothetical protein